MKQNNLNPCPICKCKPAFQRKWVHGVANRKHYRCICKKCNMSTEWHKNAEKANEKWREKVALTKTQETKLTPVEERDFEKEVYYGDFPLQVVRSNNQIYRLDELYEDELYELELACKALRERTWGKKPPKIK